MAASMALVEKLHPARISCSGFMQRLVAYMMGNVYFDGDLPSDAFVRIEWTSDGYMLLSHVEDGGSMDRFTGVSPSSLRENFRGYLEVAELTEEEHQEATQRFEDAFRISLDTQ